MFKKPRKPETLPHALPDIPEGRWVKCPSCKHLLYRTQLERALWVCPFCGLHFRIPAEHYAILLLDEDSWESTDFNLLSQDPLQFPEYQTKLQRAQKHTGLKDAAKVYRGTLEGHPVILFTTDFRVLAGSMGSVVGEVFVRAARLSLHECKPFLALTASGGGARMQEGIIALMQMAKTTAAVREIHEAGIPYINILTDPTMGGVMASFASLGDILIAEPGALLGFAGPRVIQQTIRQKLPKGFQRSEFLLEHGMIDMVVPRHRLKTTLGGILSILWGDRHGRSSS